MYLIFTALRVDDVVLIRNCPPVSKRKRFTAESLLRSPEGEVEARREAAALQAQMEGGVPPSLTPWTSSKREGVRARAFVLILFVARVAHRSCRACRHLPDGHRQRLTPCLSDNELC